MARFDLTDAESAVIEPLLPTDVRGKERVDDRRVATTTTIDPTRPWVA